MKSRPSASLVRVDRRLSTPLFRQVYQRVRNAVLDGTLAPGARLPSSRSLAGQLSIARGTIELAYALLADEGYVAGMRRTGTIVNAGLSRKSMSPGNGRRSYGSLAELGHEFVRPKPARPFQMGLPALDEFPRKLWARLVARRARGLSAIAMVSQDPAGYAPLRQAISGYLAIARGGPVSYRSSLDYRRVSRCRGSFCTNAAFRRQCGVV
jgi:GntR family transcriptional regulator / MocR family aminotransferase